MLKEFLRRAVGASSRRPSGSSDAYLYEGAGIDWNPNAIEKGFILLEEFRGEFSLFPARGKGGEYQYENPYFSLVDAAVCHSFIRARRPSLVVEVGCGFSSIVLRGALERNETGRLICIDPQPRVELEGIAHEFRRQKVQEIPLEFFRRLPSDSVLFIDSSHKAGAGTDVNFLFLEVIPALPPGVLVQVHDIYLPEDYPASWNVDAKWDYTEQYLLHALLAHSKALEVVWPGRYVVRERGIQLSSFFVDPSLLGLHCSFWFERIAP